MLRLKIGLTSRSGRLFVIVLEKRRVRAEEIKRRIRKGCHEKIKIQSILMLAARKKKKEKKTDMCTEQ